ncbi:hypothetical protein S7711_03806 [Stachybotrys chartarum IBT 7711]|uniref:Major facilitator superfamily (MFS) profile domain-containing protein n=1 Tax=Stachybotrys chartarum (strain CBS 109288 / IBT 7711) TaxID=1280523 RepID=A0A084AU91_STACB|nr:hypothetical protein S7711_03806 [Stachybotrys chartarum IBT 7711]KFA46946.1 hypothetical protein S40293_03622 [Stachybotrys chartarum IBT 40293]
MAPLAPMGQTSDIESANTTEKAAMETAIDGPTNGSARDESSSPDQAQQLDAAWVWEEDPANPVNWSSRKKLLQVLAASTAAFTASVGTSLISPGRVQIQEEFNVTSVQAILPLSLYVFALGLGPVLSGPLSETLGRLPVYLGSMPIGACFALGAGLTHNFHALCFLRFMAGFAFSPSLAIGAGTINDVYKPSQRAMPSTIFILMPFLGPGFG